jgi:hypothetical protein
VAGELFSLLERAQGGKLPGVIRPRSAAALALALALVLAAVFVATTRHNEERHFLATQRYEDVYYLPPPAWLAVFSLGHREALADLIWLRSLIYFGDELVHRGPVENLYNYTDAMLSLDPHFKKVYSWISSCALYRTGAITATDARRVIAYLERGVQLFPDDGELAWTLGANYLYELPPLLHDDPKAVAEAKLRGLEHLKVASLRGAGPAWLALTTATELGRLGQREQQIAHLQEVYAQISDPRVKDQIEIRLSKLRSTAFAEALHRTYEELENRRKHDFPYIDQELYLLVGPRPPFDGRALLLRDFDPETERFETDSDSAELDTPP